jgi:ERCC4-type nuclease
MLELQNIKGVGEKTFEKIYTFVNSNQNNRLQTEGEIQPSFKLE